MKFLDYDYDGRIVTFSITRRRDKHDGKGRAIETDLIFPITYDYSENKNPEFYYALSEMLRIHKRRVRLGLDDSFDRYKYYLDKLQKIMDIHNAELDATGSPNTRLRFCDAVSDAIATMRNENQVNADESIPEENKSSRKVLTTAVQRIIDFFNEFDYYPSIRFVNTLAHSNSIEDALNYTQNYFKLSDAPQLVGICEKINSPEYQTIVTDIMNNSSSNRVNNRLHIYFGAPGSGKTTYASTLVNSTMVCRSDMTPQDIMEEFDFDNGNATFKPSAFYLAMERGDSILLDEINLLSYDVLRFLQGVLDNKTEITYKDRVVHIHPDFKVYGTMNLCVNGRHMPLPEPLVDRCVECREFVPDVELIVNGLL